MKKIENSLCITKDKRVLLNGHECPKATRVSIILEAGRDPEVELRIVANEVNIENYMNDMAPAILQSQSTT